MINEELNNKDIALPRRGDRILVWDYDEEGALEAIFLVYIENSRYPVIIVRDDCEELFKNDKKNDKKFETVKYKYWKPLPKTKKLFTLKELQVKIIEWAKERNIHTEDCAPKQRLKLIEECGELASAILKNNVALKKDSIGDIFAVLVNLNEQIRSNLWLDFEPTLKRTINEFEYLNLILDNHSPLFYKALFLDVLASSLDLDLTECANIAWNEIKDRTGKTVDGTFLKD